jgi:sugar/nucleoside kinase (ribokinase family)
MGQMTLGALGIDVSRRRTFDVICAGEPLWETTARPVGHRSPRMRAGLLDITRMLARRGIHVGLATVLEDDDFGRTSRRELATLGVDVRAVKMAAIARDFAIVDAAGGQSLLGSESRDEAPPEVPTAWGSQVLLLSGLSATTSRLAAFCKAARRARREGTVVVLDLTGNLRGWIDREPRVLSMLLRDADVVRSSFVDLAMIGVGATDVRSSMRPGATLVINDHDGTVVTGAFGEVRTKSFEPAIDPRRYAECCTAAICAELAKPSACGESPAGRWHRVLCHEARLLAS